MKNRWLSGITLLVLLANLGCMIWFWQQGLFKRQEPARSEPAADGPRMPFDIICQELQFDSLQRQQMMQLRDAHRAEMRPMMERMRQLRDQFFDGVKDSNQNPALEDQRYAPISKLQQQIDRVNLYHFKRIRNLCNAQQKIRFDAFYQQMLNRFQGPPIRPEGGRREPGPPGPRRPF